MENLDNLNLGHLLTHLQLQGRCTVSYGKSRFGVSQIIYKAPEAFVTLAYQALQTTQQQY
jgi:hypothetical protein